MSYECRRMCWFYMPQGRKKKAEKKKEEEIKDKEKRGREIKRNYKRRQEEM